jgi:hypothetical protein
MKYTLLQDVALTDITSGTLQDRQATSEALQLEGPNGVIAQLVKGPEGMEAVGQLEPVLLIASKEAAKIMGKGYKASSTLYDTMSGERRLKGRKSMGKETCLAVVVTGFKDSTKATARDQLLAMCHQPNMSEHYTLSDIAKMVWRWLGSVDAAIAGQRVQTVCRQAKEWTETEVNQAAELVDIAPDNVWQRINRGQWSINLAHTIVKAAAGLTETQEQKIADKFGLKEDKEETIEQKVQDKAFSFMSVKSNRKGLTKSKEDQKRVMAALWGSKEDAYTYQAGINILNKNARDAFKKNLSEVAKLDADKVAAWTELLDGEDAKRFRSFTNAYRVAKELGHDMKHFDSRIS